jgi:hypothetical protein
MTPTEAILDKALEQKVITDERGRCLTVRRLSALDTLRLLKAAGPVLSQNQAWLNVASIAISVIAIDGLPLPVPSSEAQIEAAVVRLGDEGLTSAASAFDSDSPHDRDLDKVGNLRSTPT